jgi:sortase A
MLGVWVAVNLIEANYVKQLPVPVERVKVTAESPRRLPSTGAWVARLDAPTAGLEATVLEGSDDQTLSLGAGHIEGTAFPGDPGNVGIAGHRDTTFRAVRRLKRGDPLVLTTGDRVYEYRISSTFIVNPKDVYVLDPTEHQALTLVTCYPFEFIGHAPQRYIVRADLVKGTARSDTKAGQGSTP